VYKTATGEPCQAKPGSPVELGRVPDWLRRRMLKVFGPTDCGYTDGHSLFAYWARKCKSLPWIDHWGTTVIDGQKILVSEPYLRRSCDFSDVAEFAESLGCELVIDETSYWYPGKTLRLAFMP